MMKYKAQQQTRFDAHGHWRTVHTIEVTSNDAYGILLLLQEKYGDKIPVEWQETRNVMKQITAAKP